MMRFLQGFFLSAEERRIRRVAAESGAAAVILVVRRAPMANVVEQLQFERMADRVVSSVRKTVRGNPEDAGAVTITPAAFDSAFAMIGEAREKLTFRENLGVRGGMVCLLLRADAAGSSRLLVRWPFRNSLVRRIFETLTPNPL